MPITPVDMQFIVDDAGAVDKSASEEARAVIRAERLGRAEVAE